MEVITPQDAVREIELLNNPAVSVKTIFDMVVIVLRQDGKQEQYDATGLTKDWLRLSNHDLFVECYGFDWKPSPILKSKIRGEQKCRKTT